MTARVLERKSHKKVAYRPTCSGVRYLPPEPFLNWLDKRPLQGRELADYIGQNGHAVVRRVNDIRNGKQELISERHIDITGCAFGRTRLWEDLYPEIDWRQ